MRIEVKTGLYAVIIIAATLFIVEFLRGKDIFSKNNTYYIIYPSVDGIEVSTAVTVGGFPAGRISEIQYNRESADYTVQVSISRQFSIPEDSRMLIYSSDILGTKKIKVAAGTSSVPASAGDTLTGGFEADMLSTLAGSISPVAAGLDSAAASAGNTLANAEEITAGLRDAGLGAAVDSITRLSNDLDSLIRGIKEDPKMYIKISVF